MSGCHQHPVPWCATCRMVLDALREMHDDSKPCFVCGKPTKRKAIFRGGSAPCCDSLDCFESLTTPKRSAAK